MADGMTTAAETAGALYERDFHAWTQAQAAALRAAAVSAGAEGAAASDAPLDHGNLAEEIESLGRSDREKVEARIARIIEHLLKLECSPSTVPRAGWRATVREARAALARSFKHSPSLHRVAREAVEEETAGAARTAAEALADHGEDASLVRARLDGGGYTAEQVLGDWWPASPPPAGPPSPFP